MKKFMVAAMVVGLGMVSVTGTVFADGCYLCQEGGYVKYQGDDTFAKRKKAKEQFGCTVSGTTSSCSNSRGTVAWYQRFTGCRPVV